MIDASAVYDPKKFDAFCTALEDRLLAAINGEKSIELSPVEAYVMFVFMQDAMACASAAKMCGEAGKVVDSTAIRFVHRIMDDMLPQWRAIEGRETVQ